MKKTLMRKILSMVLSAILIATSFSAVMALPVSAETIAPTVYENNYEEELLGSFIAKGGMTGINQYSLFEEDGNTVMKYSATGVYGNTYINGIYMPDTITQANLNSYSWSYPFVAKASDGINYLHVSFRYKVANFASDCSAANIYLSTYNASNAYSNIKNQVLLASTSKSGEWITVDEVVAIDATGLDWQKNGLALGIKDTRGEIYIDDVVIEDYTATDSFYVTFETGDGEAVESGFYSPSDVLPITAKADYEFKGWYLDSDYTTPFDITTYNRAESGFAVTLYAKYRALVKEYIAPKVYTNNYEEDLLGSFLAKGITATNQFGLAEVDGNTVMKYSATGVYGVTYINGVYIPEKITQKELDANTMNFFVMAQAKENAVNYLRVKFRYKIDNFASDCGRAVFYLSTYNSGNAYNAINNKALLATATKVGEWVTVDELVKVDGTGLNWQSSGLAISVYDTRGEIYFDDVVIEDYTETNAVFATLMDGETEIDKIVVSSVADLPDVANNGKEITGWFIDSALEVPFDFNAYEDGREVTLYAKKSNVTVYKNNFEDRAPSIKFNAFSTETLQDGNTALKYTMKKDDSYWTTWNYCAFYNNVTSENYISNGATTGIYKVSFRYKVDSVADGSAINFGLGISHFGNIWAAQSLSKAIGGSGVTDGWVEMEANVAIVSPENWQVRAVSLVVSGQGTAYIDDVEIVKYKDTDYSLVNYYSNGNLIKDEIALLSDIKPDSAYEWYLDADCTEEYVTLADRAEGSVENMVVSLYGKFTNVITYNNTFEDSAPSVKFNAFTTETSEDGNTVLKYTSDNNAYIWNYCAFYDNITDKNYIYNGEATGIYKISFRYKVDDVPDGGVIDFGLGLAHFGNVWANPSNFKKVCSSYVTDGWVEVEANVAMTSPVSPWQVRAVSLSIMGVGVAYVDDVEIMQYTDSDYSLVNYYADGKLISDEIVRLSKINPDSNYNWYTDADCTVAFTTLSDRVEGSEENKVVNLYGVEKPVGDFDGDGKINATDLAIMMKHFLGVSIEQYDFDVNKDGCTDVRDIVALKNFS